MVGDSKVGGLSVPLRGEGRRLEQMLRVYSQDSAPFEGRRGGMERGIRARQGGIRGEDDLQTIAELEEENLKLHSQQKELEMKLENSQAQAKTLKERCIVLENSVWTLEVALKEKQHLLEMHNGGYTTVNGAIRLTTSDTSKLQGLYHTGSLNIGIDSRHKQNGIPHAHSLSSIAHSSLYPSLMISASPISEVQMQPILAPTDHDRPSSLVFCPSPSADCPSTSISQWQQALQKVLREKQELAALLRRYQKLVAIYRQQNYRHFLTAVDASFRRRAGTAEGRTPATAMSTQDMAVEAEVEMEEAGERLEKMQQEKLEGCTTATWHSCLELSDDTLIRRRLSGSSSFLYAGVCTEQEPKQQSSSPPSSNTAIPPILTSPSPPPPSTTPILKDAQVETVTDQADFELCSDILSDRNLHVLPALANLMRGSWVYKYPRRQNNKLILQPALPLSHLHYRYFWLQPSHSLLCWAREGTPRQCKSVRVNEYYTDSRLLPPATTTTSRTDQQNSNQQATIIIIITDQPRPLTIVPPTSEDLGLQLFFAMRRSPIWPSNLAIADLDGTTH